MIGLKSKSENEIILSYDINLLHTLKLMPEAVLNFSSLLHCMFCLFPSSPTACSARCSPLLMFAYDTAKLNDVFLTSLK